MSKDAPLAEFEFRSGEQRGSQLTLYPNRIVHQGGDAMETVPLAKLASVRIAFAREPGKLNWAIALVLIALALAAASGPLQGWIAGAAARMGENARRESLDAVLQSVLTALGGLAALLPLVAGALSALAVALLVMFGLGWTRLTLSFGASERVFSVRGRNRRLLEFAEALGDHIADREG